MNRLLLSTIAIAIVHLNTVLAQCGPTNVDATPLASAYCEGETATINFQSYGTCAGSYEYQVMDGATIVQAWSATASYSIIPTTTTTYTIQSRCTSCPATVVSDTFLIEFIAAPIITGDTLVCEATATSLTATGSNGTIEWWSAPTGGTQLSANGNYTTPPLSTDETYYVNVTSAVSGGTGQGQVLITECGLAGFQVGSDNDYVEISNLFSTPVNTAGWKVVISNSYSNINTYNSTIWNLPASFAPCSILSKTDISGSSNYWGSNILWNPSLEGWAMILDNNWNVVDFVCWGWTAAELASFAPVIAGNPITLGAQWVGAACPSACGSTASPASISRFGGTDNNNAGDFVCQATSLNALNPGLPCGWSTSSMSCPFPVNIVVDQAPTASNAATLNVECIGDVPAPDPSVITTEADDFSIPTVTFLSESSNGLTCPEVITRTYRVQDSCSNYVDVTHTINVQDITPPNMDPAPADLTVSCYADVPVMISLNWTDNCDGNGAVSGNDVSNGLSCPETITRTWTYTDACGNNVTRTQNIVIHDTQAPVIDPAPASVTVSCYAQVPSMPSLNWTDNCDGSGTLTGTEVSSGTTCPEILTRTWTYTDGCGNTSTETQTITIHDLEAPVLQSAPTNVFVECYADVPVMNPLNWTDNCDGSGAVNGVEVSSGTTCPEILTRTWTYTDGCGNTATETQTVTIHDVTAPVAGNLPTIQLVSLPAPDPTIVNATDNCGSPVVTWLEDVSDNGFCPENVIRTYVVTDDCGNEKYVTQHFIVGDPIPEVNFTAEPTTMDNLSDGIVEFENLTTGANYYEWYFDDGSIVSNEINPTHEFPHDEAGGFVVTLIGYSPFGCSDTFTVVITVNEVLLYYIPNSFTPDGDEYNNVWQPVFTSGFDPQQFHLTLYDRWGELIWESYDASVGWDGTYNGKFVPFGTYIYKIEFKRDSSSDREVVSGHVTIIR